MTRHSAASPHRPFAVVLAAITIGTLILHLNTLRRPHIEGDEIVFTFLAEKLRTNITDYSTQGDLVGPAARRFIHEIWEPNTDRQFPNVDRASVLFSAPDETGNTVRNFDPALYDQPLFFHPPLFPYTLAAVRTTLGTRAAALLPVLFEIGTIVIVAFLGRLFASELIGLAAAGLMAVESVSWLAAERLWIDSMMQMLVTASVLAALWSARRGKTWRFAIAGAVLGLAGLTKLQAGLVVPGILTIWFVESRRPSAREVLAYLIPPTVLIGAWLIVSKVLLGVFFPIGWPTPWMVTHFPWIQRMLQRTPLLYIIGLALVSPMLLFALPGALQARRARWLMVPTVWALSFWLGLSALGMAGMGFQLRHIASGIPALCLLAAVGVFSLPVGWRAAIVVPLAVYSLLTGVNSALMPGAVDPVPEALRAYLAELSGWDISHIPGVW